jgi:hypothetical protein
LDEVIASGRTSLTTVGVTASFAPFASSDEPARRLFSVLFRRAGLLNEVLTWVRRSQVAALILFLLIATAGAAFGAHAALLGIVVIAPYSWPQASTARCSPTMLHQH